VIRTSAVVTAAVICAVVLTVTTPAQAADQSEIKRAIVVTVLNNLGVQPTDQLVNEIVGDIPIEFLDSMLVREVGTALDNSEDPTLAISRTVDSDGDGLPNADATVDATDDSVDETENESDEDSTPATKPNSDERDDESEDEGGDHDSDHDGDHDDN
jgi:hypothetical protein